jgi:DNA gyrase/topoisomerase IV subunit A
MDTKKIEDFLTNEYKEFAMYSLEMRAIASVIDGFKPVQRKIVYVSGKVWKTGREKPLKVFQLSGKVASDSFYHHGDKSLSDAIINMAQSFKNNAPLLDEDGQFGSLRSPEAGAPRYIGTRLNSNYLKIYKDSNLLENQVEEGEKIEPKFLLPIIPMVLVNGGGGIAVGFKSNILNRDVKQVARDCLNFLKTGKSKNIPPSLNGFTGTYTNDDTDHKKWIISGVYTKVNTTTINITELPPTMTYEKYETHLEKLVNDGIITSYEDNCKDDVNYVIKMKRADLAKFTNEQIVKILKLEEKQHELYNTLDENGKLMIFENVSDIVKYFVKYRLKWYDVRKKNIIGEITRDLSFMDNRSKFISLIIKGAVVVNNKRKADIEKMISKHKLDKIDGSYDYLLRIPIHNLTKENYDKIKEDILLKKKELVDMKKKKPKDIYMEELDEFIKKWK